MRIKDQIVVKRPIRHPGRRLTPEERKPEQAGVADAGVAGQRKDRGPGEVAQADLHVDESERGRGRR